MSTTDYWKDLVTLLNQNMTRYGMGTIWVVGNFGSFFSCWIFLQPSLRKNPCVMYFLASSASQFLTFNFALFTRMLHFGYNIQTLNSIRWYCKIRFYIFYIAIAMPRYQIVMASIDRYFASCDDISWRRWSSRKIAKKCIIFSFIFWCLIYIQALVFYDTQFGFCTYQGGIYGIFFSIYLSIESGILPPLLMLIFGLLTIRNIRRSKRTVQPEPLANVVSPTQTIRLSRKDLQLTNMLLGQIGVWITFNIPYPCYNLYRSITINDPTSDFRITVESFASNMTTCALYVGFSLTVFLYTLSSPLFRHELKKLILRKILRRPIIVDERHNI